MRERHIVQTVLMYRIFGVKAREREEKERGCRMALREERESKREEKEEREGVWGSAF